MQQFSVMRYKQKTHLNYYKPKRRVIIESMEIYSKEVIKVKKQSKSSIYGYWFSYIDALTVLAAIFVILFIASISSRLWNKATIDVEQLIKERNDLFEKNKNLSLVLEAQTKKLAKFEEAWENVIVALGSRGIQYETLFNDGGMKINISEKILFRVNSADISEQGYEHLKTLTGIINHFIADSEIRRTIRIIIGGYADTTGNRIWTVAQRKEFNLALSQRRAANVASELQKTFNDIPMEAVGYGENTEKPTPQDNRRITLVIQPIAKDLLPPATAQETPRAFFYIDDLSYKKLQNTPNKKQR